MQLHQCPSCGHVYDDSLDRCPNCHFPTDGTVRFPVDHNPPSGQPEPKHPEPPKKKQPWKPILLVVTILFIAFDVVLYFHFENRRKDAETQRLETARQLAEQRRQDSIKAVERAAFVEDSIRTDRETRGRFVKPANIMTPITAENRDAFGDYSDAPAQIVSNNLESDLVSQGYTNIFTRRRAVEVEGGEIVNMPIRVFGINCRWDSSGKYPVPTADAWSCVVIQDDECSQSLKIFFDSVTSCIEFFNKLTQRNMTRVSSMHYTSLRAYRTTGGVYVEDGLCGPEIEVTRNDDNSISIN